ncbi:hypothetical protein Tco_0724522 [Tanacetum coccineum]
MPVAYFDAIDADLVYEATTETQTTLLKQMYETFNASSSESLNSIFNRLQKIVSQLTILGEIITLEELNLKFLRSLPTEWGMHVVVWRKKSDMGSISFDDNFKIVEPEVKRNTGSTPVSTASTNNSTTCLSDATIYAYLATQPNGSQVVHEDLEQIHEDDLDEMDLKWQLALLSMKARKFYQRTGLKRLSSMGRKPRSQENRNRSQDSSRRIVNVEESYSKAIRNFAPTAVLTKSGLVPFSTARQSFSRTTAPVSAARSFNTVVPSINVVKPRTNAFQKSHSPLRRPFYQQTTLKNRNLNNKVNTAKVISVNTVKGKRMTSAVGEQEINVVKPTAYWAWRPKIKMINHVYKNTGSCICKQFNYVDPTGRNKVLNSPYFMVKSWLVQDQTVVALAIPGQMRTGKESSNPFMAGSLPKNNKSNDPPLTKGYILGSREDSLKLIELMDLCTKLIDKVTILGNALKQFMESHAKTLTMLMKKTCRVLNSPYFMVKSWLVQDQTVLALAIPGQMRTGKESSNSFMAGSLPKNYKSNDPPLTKGYILVSGEDSLKLIELMDLCTKLIDKVTILENALKQFMESHAKTLTMLMKKVKRLEDKLKL